jgi:hypothetical protein
MENKTDTTKIQLKTILPEVNLSVIIFLNLRWTKSKTKPILGKKDQLL